MTVERTRLAPSPTGALHLGNARTFLINWAMARQAGWEIVLRIEDLDGPRIKANADHDAIDILRWLGMDWDDGPHYQRADLSRYQQALAMLGSRGWIYRCTCSRKEIESAQSAPHESRTSHDVRYPGTCRPAQSEPVSIVLEESTDAAWRLRVPDEVIAYTDAFFGEQADNVQQLVGDFIVATKAALPAYQLAVVVDDAAAGVTQVVRGEDLLRSTPRQMILYRMLGLHPVPRYTHVPLVLGADGRKLAKRHGDTRLAYYRSEGVRPQRVVGLLAEWCGMGPRREMDASEFLAGFSLEKVSARAVVFEAKDDAWLKEG